MPPEAAAGASQGGQGEQGESQERYFFHDSINSFCYFLVQTSLDFSNSSSRGIHSVRFRQQKVVHPHEFFCNTNEDIVFEVVISSELLLSI